MLNYDINFDTDTKLAFSGIHIPHDKNTKCSIVYEKSDRKMNTYLCMV